jgi:hypothetical protein
MQNIINKLVEGNPLFMLGYGASGAGKTSSLIYFKNAEDEKDKPGVIIHLCNLMANKGYRTIKLQYAEYYYKKSKDPIKEYEYKQILNDEQASEYPLVFNYNENQFKLSSKYEHTVMHPYRFENMKPEFIKGIFDKDSNKIKTFVQGTSLGEIIINLVDTDRFVKATTNNPNSSRSHTLVFLELSDDENKKANIIVGDFAGVENEFECANPEVLNNFLNRKREDKDAIDKVNNKPFYSHNALVVTNESEQGILDPIDKDDPKTSDFGKIKAIDNNDEKAYDFDKIDERDNRNKVFIEEHNALNILNKKNLIDKEFMQKYVPFVRKFVKAMEHDNKKYVQTRWENVAEINSAYNKTYEIKEAIEKLLNVFKLVNEKDKDFFKINVMNYIPEEKKKLEIELLKKISEFEKLQNDIKNLEDSIKNNKEISQINNCKKVIIDMLTTSSKGKRLYPESYLEKYDVSRWENFLNVTKANNFTEGTNFLDRFSNYIIFIFKGKFCMNTLKEILDLTPTTEYKIEDLKDKIKEKIQYISQAYNIGGFLKLFDILVEKKIELLRNNPAFLKINNLKEDIDNITEEISEFDNIDKKADILKDMKIDQLIINKNVTYQGYCNNIIKLIGLDKNVDILDFLRINKSNNLSDLSKALKEDELNLLILAIETENEGTKYKNLLDLLKKMEIENFNRQQGIKEICENRLIEGKFINSSLFEVRNTIKQILYQKNSGQNISPKFIDECFDQYCPNHEYCFSSEEEEENKIKIEKPDDSNKKIQDVSERQFTDIFGKIYDVLKDKTKFGNNINIEKWKTINDMYKDIIVSVFCVFNISKTANDPPSVPYIDINNLKYIFNFKIGNTKNLIIYLKQAINDIEKYQTKTENLLQTEIIDKNNINEDIKKAKTVVDAIKFICNINSNNNNDDDDDNNNNNNNDYFINNGKQGIFFEFMKKIVQQFIDLIDKNNAISAIGTLEFLDQIAKFNKVSNICRADFNIDSTAIKKIELSNMVHLYHK